MAIIVDRRQALWFSDNYPGARMDTNCGALHTTESYTMPSYAGGATAPNYTAEPAFGRKRLVFVPHFSDNESARALVNAPGGVETNTMNVLQIELIGTCDPKTHLKWLALGKRHIYWPKAPAWALRDLAEFIAVKGKELGIPAQGPGKPWLPYPKSYGTVNGQRMSFSEWHAFKGWCGHQHVPENVHGDPGAFPWDAVQAIARSYTGQPQPATPSDTPTPAPPVVARKEVTTPDVDALYEDADKLRLRAAKYGRKRKAAALQRVLDLLKPFSAKH